MVDPFGAMLSALPGDRAVGPDGGGLREHSACLADEAERVGGKAARLSLLRALFARGAFAGPPLTGPPYDAWRELDAARREESGPPDAGPLLSVLLPVYNPRPEHLDRALTSLTRQTWLRWECCAVDDASTDPAAAAVLRHYAEADARFRLTFRPVNGHICAATNTALDMARGEWCALLDQDDILEPDALARMVAAAVRHPESVVIFSDQDQMEDAPGVFRRDNPFFKPGPDPDLLLAFNIVSHLGVYRTGALRRLGGFRIGLEGAQDHDLALRCLAVFGPEAFTHVPEPLYHWRRHAGSTSQGWNAKPYARAASLAARRDYAANAGLRTEFTLQPDSLYAAVRFAPPSPSPLLSLCLLVEAEGMDVQAARRVLECCSYAKREGVVAVAADALPPAKIRVLERLVAECRARLGPVSGRPDAFGLAEAAARAARGGALAFIRAGDVPARADWADRAVGALWRADVGTTGCRGVLPAGFLSQAGYATGREGPGGEGRLTLCPAYAGLHVEAGGYFRQAHLMRSAFAVPLTGLCCRRETFERLGGFDAACGELADADFCLRALNGDGLRSVVLPDADFLTPRVEVPRVAGEIFAARWSGLLRESPPFQNPHLLWTPGGWQLRPPGV